MLARRTFLLGLTSALAAPAIVRAGSLMPVRAIATSKGFNSLLIEKISEVYADYMTNRIIYGYGAIMPIDNFPFIESVHPKDIFVHPERHIKGLLP